MPSSILRAGVLFGRDSGPPPPIPAALVGRFMDTPQMSGRGMAESDLALFLEPRFVEGLNPWGTPDYGSCCYMHGGSAIFLSWLGRATCTTIGWNATFAVTGFPVSAIIGVP